MGMRRTTPQIPLRRKNKLTTTKGTRKMTINRYSEKRIAELQAEAPIRIELCKRAGGTPITREVQIYHSGQKFTYTKVECAGGKCECGLPDCPKIPRPGEHLEPHELQQRSLGGKLSLENSRMVLRACHRKLQNDEPRWSKP